MNKRITEVFVENPLALPGSTNFTTFLTTPSTTITNTKPARNQTTPQLLMNENFQVEISETKGPYQIRDVLLALWLSRLSWLLYRHLLFPLPDSPIRFSLDLRKVISEFVFFIPLS